MKHAQSTSRKYTPVHAYGRAAMPRPVALALAALLALVMTACIEDGYTTSPKDQPQYSVDTLQMGTVYTAELTTTHRFTVYNRCSKGLNVQHIALRGDNADLFRLNVDGMSGTTFSNIEIRAHDSIFVFVDATFPENGGKAPREMTADIDFTVNGVTSSVAVHAQSQDVTRLQALTLDTDTRFTADHLYKVTDSLVVPEGVTLTLEAGTEMRFHDGAYMLVRGTLRCLGEAGAPVRLTGDRTGNVITDVSFSLMSRQWGGLLFQQPSTSNFMQHTEVSNTTWGVVLTADGKETSEKTLTLHNCRLRNSGGNVLTSEGASIEALGCEFAEAAVSLVQLAGGDHRFDQCTLSNHYLFAAVSGAAWAFPDLASSEQYAGMLPTRALVTNTITWGLGADCAPGDLTGYEVYFNHCLFKSNGTDDANFIDTIWDTDPMFYTVRSEYLFDYRLKPESPAIGAAYPGLSDTLLATDWYGLPRGCDLGAYVFSNESQPDTPKQ